MFDQYTCLVYSNVMQLQTWCEKHGVREAKLRKLLRVSQQSASRYLLGQRIPRKDVMRRIHSITDGEVTANDFYPAPRKRVA